MLSLMIPDWLNIAYHCNNKEFFTSFSVNRFMML